MFVVVNFVCGCVVANVCLGVKLVVQYDKKLDYMVIVFVGVDKEVIVKAWEYMAFYLLFLFFIVLFKDGKLVYFLECYYIEGCFVEIIVENLKLVFDCYC